MAEKFATRILTNVDPNPRYRYRVGYCPAVFDGGFWHAKTLLLPVMEGTPEYRRVVRQTITSSERHWEARERAERVSFLRLDESEDLELVKSFHDQGIPQVITT